MNNHPVDRGRKRRAPRTIALLVLRSCVLAAGLLLPLAAAADAGEGDRPVGRPLPPAAVKLLEAAPLATPSIAPNNRYLLLARRHGLLERRQLAARTVSIGGRRIDPRTHGPHAPLNYYGFSVVNLESGERSEIALPPDVTASFPFWAPDGSRFAFTLTRSGGIELWIGEPGEGSARRLVDDLNAVFSQPCVWLSDSRHVLCRRVDGPGGVSSAYTGDHPGDRPPVAGLSASLLQTSAPGATGIRQLVESRLQWIDVESGRRRDVGRTTAITSVDPAPNWAFLLVTRIREPYAHVGGLNRATALTEVWDRSGRVIKTLPASQRALQWRPDQPATLAWVEREQGMDRLMIQTPPFTAPAQQVFALEHDFAGLDWLEGTDSALVSEYLPDRRVARRWLIDTGPGHAPPRRLGSYPVDAKGGGLPLNKINHWGKSIVAVHDGGFFLHGRTLTDDGRDALYIDRVDLDAASRSRLWTDDGDGYGRIVNVLSDDARLLLTRHETAGAPPNFFLTDRTAGSRLRLTYNTHPAPALKQVEQIPLKYTRDDGVPLSATLYVPARDDPREPLPLIVWAYPKEVGDEAVFSDLPSADRYMGSERALKLFFLLCGYAVMDDVSMPVVGGDGNANDSFVEQVVANAQATVAAAADTGLIDPSRVAVAGHSYGAFMVGNLLAHSQLFRAGAALSGAYNRTLTPFGFQTEQRTLWEAPETYLAMSPLLYSNRIDAPLLLVHGMEDNNAGATPIQSLQFYQAIRGNGGDAELLLLPREGHTYRARESVLETASAMLNWFDRHLKAPPGRHEPIQTSAVATE